MKMGKYSNRVLEEEEEEEDVELWEDWEDEIDEAGNTQLNSTFLCLFCDSKFGSCRCLLDHCRTLHHFDFQKLRKSLKLDFYGSVKLVNYVRSQVADNRCWICELCFDSSGDLQNHLHETVELESTKVLWQDDKYLIPFMPSDSFLYSFSGDDSDHGDDDDDGGVVVHRKVEGVKNLVRKEQFCEDDLKLEETHCSESPRVAYEGEEHFMVAYPHGNATRKITQANESYFRAYSSFGIHREMISDKVRMEAYKQAILENPLLFNDAVVIDVGCGTGILSLFAARAGASRVIAVEASEKMAEMATQIAKDNGLWKNSSQLNSKEKGVIEVVQCMVEVLDESMAIEPNSVDVLVSEWMGYCLLYESMLPSILCVRDRWLKPGGAILPDTATMYAAGFGVGASSFPFWEDVYGFDMSCIGKEDAQNMARMPLIDVVNGDCLVTDPVLLQAFDLVTMKADDVNFTASIELKPKSEEEEDAGIIQCYGVVLWFDAGFTSRFCRESSAILTTSPCSPPTHWSQTVLTFVEPISMASSSTLFPIVESAAIGTSANPVAQIHLRVSIARAPHFRSIDISLEPIGVCCNGRSRCWPVQMFPLK